MLEEINSKLKYCHVVLVESPLNDGHFAPSIGVVGLMTLQRVLKNV